MNTDDLITQSRTRFEHTTAKRVLKEKYQAKLLFAHAGGMWQAGPELLTLLHIVKENDPVVLLDLYQNPVRVNPKEIAEIAMYRWQEQMNAWLIEHEEINQQR